MSRKLLGALGGLLTAAGLGSAQAPVETIVPGHATVAVPAGAVEAPSAATTAAYQAPAHRDPDFWGGFEYLLWWVRPGPVSVPLVTTQRVPADLRPFAAGGLADPNAVVLFGNQNIDYGRFSGGRYTSGMWLDNCQTVGVDSSLYFLEQRSARFAFASDANGLPALTIPFNSVTPGAEGETSAVIAGTIAGVPRQGTIVIGSTSQLWGGDTDLIFNLWRNDCRTWRLDALVGGKYLQLQEDLNIAGTLTSVPGGSTFEDRFGTRNRFYGGQLGARLSGQWGAFGGQLTGKFAVGDNNETLNIGGTTVLPAGAGVVPGGGLAVSSNSGSNSHDRFGMAPEVTGNIYYDVTCNIRMFVGYNWLYWTNVMRPGDQIDRNANMNLIPGFGGGPGGTGPLAPARLNRETDFWAHGVSFGVAIQF